MVYSVNMATPTLSKLRMGGPHQRTVSSPGLQSRSASVHTNVTPCTLEPRHSRCSTAQGVKQAWLQTAGPW
jgi:hypothetical protein